ncbi:SLC13 family permease [Desulfobacter hydrogenophilus]|uniref:SLC13 family permease n=2 Tax=Desulfobacter hydrogenophilus TaxID=2291 RepID=A0A328F7G8_9BACT|nr:SLC13 family permease [Desulfobacter hydrogenophilus]QBH11530.1 SLC13 family permease [Desulfobacter hydrogenophilus]RAM00518.1 SLC13 family permease [Desulfobacter hydrogenophilus]
MILPPPPNAHAVAVLILAVVALILFTREKIPLESSSFLVLIGLVVGFELFPFQVDGGVLHAVDFFQGFGHEALVAVCALMIAGQGIVRTGALEPVGRVMARLWKVSPSLSLLLTLVVGAFISAFINNVPVVVLFLPILINVSLRTGMKASSVLMPMGFATLLGGTCTTIGTSTNLLVVSVASDMGLKRMDMFDFMVPAAIAGSVGIVYLWLVAPRIIPERKPTLADTSLRVFSAHLAVIEGTPIEGMTLADARKKVDGSMKVLSVERGLNNFLIPFPTLVLKAGDHLIIRDTPDRLKEFEKVLEGTLYADDAMVAPVDDEHPLEDENQQIAEVVLVEGSRFAGRTLNGIRFADRYGMIALAIHRASRHPEKLYDKIGDIRLKGGDILLVQGPREQIAGLKKEKDFLVLDATTDLPFERKAPVALLIMLGIVVSAAVGFLPIAISAPLGALMMIFTGCLEWRDATNALNAQVILIVAASLAIGVALLKTGGADYLAQIFVTLAGDTSPTFVISGLMLLIGILTNIVSNNAAAVIGTPIAVSIATQMGQPPEPFVLAVLFGANMSYATPMAYKTNLLVMNAGKYHFNDFLRIGVPLVLIMWITLSWLLPIIYGIGP